MTCPNRTNENYPDAEQERRERARLNLPFGKPAALLTPIPIDETEVVEIEDESEITDSEDN